MAVFAHWMRVVGEWIVRPFDYAGGLLGLTIFSVLSGIGMLWVMGKTTDQKGMEKAREQMAAATYEIRIFLDSPGRVLRAQLRLIRWNAHYVACLLPALLILMGPLLLLYMPLDARFGWEPIQPGQDTLIMVDFHEGTNGAKLEVDEEKCSGVQVTAPPLYVAEESRVYLRAKITDGQEHTLGVRLGEYRITKTVSGTNAAGFVSPERASGISHLWAIGLENPIAIESGIQEVEVQHQPRNLDIFGVPMPWWFYWLVVSLVAAFALRGPMGVVL